MASLLNLTISDLLDDERITMVKRIRPLLEVLPAETDLFLPEIVSAITLTTEELSEAMTRVLASKITVLMKEADDKRDEAIDIIDDAITFYGKKRDPRYKSASSTLGEIFDDAFAGVSLSNNTLETNRIDIFLENSKTPEVQSAVETLHLEVEMHDLSVNNPEYESLRQERATLKESDTTPLLQPSRRALDRNIAFLESYLEFKISQGSDVHRSLADELSVPLTEIMSVARARKTRDEKSAS